MVLILLQMPQFLDFTITWLALSNSFWNPFLFWLLNNNFRRISKELFLTKVAYLFFTFKQTNI